MLRLREHPACLERASAWFHGKWGIPEEIYADSMRACLKGAAAVPQWYVVMDGDKIVAGLGVIDNDFHDRPDLTPNVCGVYVEEAYRRRGIAGWMLRFVCDDFLAKGIGCLYLATDHTSFYERYGWEFFCMVQGDGDAAMSRLYRHTAQSV